MKTKKIILGSAQFGMNYGISNTEGQSQEKEVQKIFQIASKNKINKIDTASAYGTSEIVIGKNAPENLEVITKISSANLSKNEISLFVNKQFSASLTNLNRTRCEGVLLHNANDLLKSHGKYWYDALSELKAKNKVNKIGISVYSLEQTYEILEQYNIDIIQFPLSLFDQRFIQNKFLSHLKAHNIELHARSIFLQGLLLMKQDNIPDYFDEVKPLLKELHSECEAKKLTVSQALIEFATSINEIDHYIFGVNNATQLEEIIHNFTHTHETPRLNVNKYSCTNIKIINPSTWKFQ